ncbi:M14 family zinc carboxypeptidase [Streptomyces sp. NPDC087270]|uniref:M14 family zinc carboxypeptidase n=1 Tax=Streptomyces sp. NPDC087270 TaxID=3365774 RepID=UPI00381AFBC5
MTSAMADAYPSVAGVVATAAAFAGFHPGLCELRAVGRSRAGRPLHVLTVGHGRRNVLVVAGPHSDERVGAATALRLAERVAHDPLLHAGADATWHLLLCLDPDGAVRHEAGPPIRRTPAAHFRHAYRPPPDEQPEWAPSIRPPDDQLPESQVLLDLIDELRPVLQCSLHGNDLGGCWVQLTRDIPGLAEPLGKLAAEHDVPVQTGTYDALRWTVSGPGVYVLPEPGARARSDRLPADVDRSTWTRPHRHGGMTALFEVPMWSARTVTDPAPHPEAAGELARLGRQLRAHARRVEVLIAEVRAVLPATAPDRAHLLRVATELAAACPQVAAEWERMPPDAVPLTAAHLAALDIAARRIPLRAAGTLLRLLDGRPGPATAEVKVACERQLARWADELTLGHDPVWVPVDEQVRVQSEAVLAAFRLAVAHG